MNSSNKEKKIIEELKKENYNLNKNYEKIKEEYKEEIEKKEEKKNVIRIVTMMIFFGIITFGFWFILYAVIGSIF